MMTRALVVCLLAGMLIQPAAAGTGPSGVERTIDRLHLPDAPSLADLGQPVASWVHAHAYLSNGTTRPMRTTLASVTSVTGNSFPCNQKLALGSDPRCVSACDASRESCERQCGSSRSTCTAQCPVLGFACDYYCQAAYLVCKSNCGRARESCVTSCPPKGGEKES
jgi:hypothetical protein